MVKAPFIYDNAKLSQNDGRPGVVMTVMRIFISQQVPPSFLDMIVKLDHPV